MARDCVRCFTKNIHIDWLYDHVWHISGEIIIVHKPESLYWENSPNPIHDSRLRSRREVVRIYRFTVVPWRTHKQWWPRSHWQRSRRAPGWLMLPGCCPEKSESGDYHGPCLLHVWYIYLQNWVISDVRTNVGIHIPAPPAPWFANMGGISGCLALSTWTNPWEKPGATCDPCETVSPWRLALQDMGLEWDNNDF